MQTYCAWLNSAPIQALPTPVRAALAHYYFERIHPFQDGNGRVGRLIEKTILISAGYGLAAYRLDAYYLTNLDQYFTLFNQARLAEDRHDDACNQHFVAFVLDGLTATIQRLYARACTLVGDFVGLALLGQLLQTKTINPRQHAILQNLLKQSGQMTEEAFKNQPWHQALYLRLSPATKSRDWQGLRDKKLIGHDAQGRLRFGPA